MITKRNFILCLLIILAISTTSFPFEIMPIHVDSLYKYSVFVGIVKVIEGKQIENFGCKYKAEVITCLKGDSTKYIEFGEYCGTEIGSEYLVFLSNESENFTDWIDKIVDDSGNVIETFPDHSKDIKLPGVLYVKYVGFGEMPIEYTIETDGDAIMICTSHVILPKTIKRYPYLIESSNLWGKYYFKKDDIVDYLRLLQKRKFN